MCVKIGNTIVQDKTVYDGAPFTSVTQNREVLAALFSDPDFDIRDGKDEDGNQVVVVDMAAKEEHGLKGSNIRCAIQDDSIAINHLFPPQTIADLAKVIASTQDVSDRIYEKLLNVYGIYDSSPNEYGKLWIAESKNIPCIKWLRERLSLNPEEIGFSHSLADGWTIVKQDGMRPVQLSFVIHTLPPGVENAPASVQRKMECTNKFDVGIATSADWEKGLGVLRGSLRDLKPNIYINMLKICTMS